jgi:hypothetical protein
LALIPGCQFICEQPIFIELTSFEVVCSFVHNSSIEGSKIFEDTRFVKDLTNDTIEEVDPVTSPSMYRDRTDNTSGEAQNVGMELKRA